jgi:hypothetical protein
MYGFYVYPPGLLHLTLGGYSLKVHCVNLYYLVKATDVQLEFAKWMQ